MTVITAVLLVRGWTLHSTKQLTQQLWLLSYVEIPVSSNFTSTVQKMSQQVKPGMNTCNISSCYSTRMVMRKKFWMIESRGVTQYLNLGQSSKFKSVVLLNINPFFFCSSSDRPHKFTERPRPGVQTVCSSFSPGNEELYCIIVLFWRGAFNMYTFSKHIFICCRNPCFKCSVLKTAEDLHKTYQNDEVIAWQSNSFIARWRGEPQKPRSAYMSA